MIYHTSIVRLDSLNQLNKPCTCTCSSVHLMIFLLSHYLQYDNYYYIIVSRNPYSCTCICTCILGLCSLLYPILLLVSIFHLATKNYSNITIHYNTIQYSKSTVNYSTQQYSILRVIKTYCTVTLQ